MKTFNNYIIEKLKLQNGSKMFMYVPKNKLELINIIKEHADNGNYNFNDIDVTAITDFKGLFNKPYLKNVDFKCSSWNMNNATSITEMFKGCEKFNDDLTNWNVSEVKFFSSVFENCKSFEGKGLSHWTPINGNYFSSMFENCINFSEDLSQWHFEAELKNMSKMFYNCKKMSFDISKWNIPKSVSKNRMLFGCKLNVIPKWYTPKDAF